MTFDSGDNWRWKAYVILTGPCRVYSAIVGFFLGVQVTAVKTNSAMPDEGSFYSEEAFLHNEELGTTLVINCASMAEAEELEQIMVKYFKDKGIEIPDLSPK
jgi:hypothetical protein